MIRIRTSIIGSISSSTCDVATIANVDDDGGDDDDGDDGDDHRPVNLVIAVLIHRP